MTSHSNRSMNLLPSWGSRNNVQPEALEDLRHWVATDRKMAQLVLELIEAWEATLHRPESQARRHLAP